MSSIDPSQGKGFAMQSHASCMDLLQIFQISESIERTLEKVVMGVARIELALTPL